MPKSIPLLYLTLNIPVKPFEVAQLRELFIRHAVDISELLQKKNLSDDLFSNEHITEKGIQFLKRYSAIQYGEENGYATVTGIGAGAAALKIFFKQPVNCVWNGRKITIGIIAQSEKRFSLIAKEKTCLYRINNYMPFKSVKSDSDGNLITSFSEWKNLDTEIERLKLIQKKMASNIITFFKANTIEYNFNVVVAIVCKHQEKWGNFHDKPQKMFDLTIRTNAQLPEGIGLGGAVAYGYGKLLSATNPKRENSRAKNIKTEKKPATPIRQQGKSSLT